MKLTSYADGDERPLAEFLTSRDRASGLGELWRWRYVEHPRAGPAPIAVLAWHRGKVVGFASALRSRLRLLGQSFESAQVSTGALALLPENSAPAEALVRALLDRLREAGVQVVYGAVQEFEYPIFATLGFDLLFDVHARNLYLGLEAVMARLDRHALAPMRRFPRVGGRVSSSLVELPLEFAALARLRAAHAGEVLVVEKSASELCWRFSSDPRHRYRLLARRAARGKGIEAFALVRNFRAPSGRVVLHVDEHWTQEPGRRAQAKLLGELALFGLSEEADILRCFAAAGSSTEQALLGLGCIKKKVGRAFVLARLDPAVPAPPSPFLAREVRLAASDLELYE